MAALTTSLLVASTALTAASTYSQYKGARNAARGADAQAKGAAELSGFEASLLESQAADALERGKEEEGRHRFNVQKFMGTQRARLAAQGIDINAGSAGAVQQETVVLSELDALTIRNNAYQEARGYKVQAELVRRGGSNQAAGYRNQAEAYRNQGWSTLLTGGAQIAGIYASTRSTVPKTKKP